MGYLATAALLFLSSASLPGSVELVWPRLAAISARYANLLLTQFLACLK